MFRLFVGTVVAACLAVPLVGCGGGEEGAPGDQAASSQSHRPVPQGESKGPRITEKPPALDIVEGVEIMPYFDEAGTAIEGAVSPGELFSFYIFVGYPEPYHVSAVEYRIDLPDGVRILGGTKFDDHALTVGNPLDDFSMAFTCRPPGKFYVMKYECLAEEGFAGGEVSITPGVRTSGKTFLGVVACSPEVYKLPAQGGSLILTKK
jgi:hypothetical protein